MNRSCLVLGSNGFVGSAIVAEARRRGWSLLPVDRNEYEAAIGSSCNVLINANGNSKKYLAAQDPSMDFDLSVRSVRHSLDDFRADLYVYLSTIDVYPDPSSPATTDEDTPIVPERLSTYGLHKWLAENLVVQGARRWLILRMGGFVGPRLWKNSIFDLLKGHPLRVHPDSAYQYLDTRELARILFDLLDKGVEGTRLNVCGDGIVTLREVAQWISDVPPPTLHPAVPLERYEIALERLKAIRPPPPTRDTVRAFIEECRRLGGIPS